MDVEFILGQLPTEPDEGVKAFVKRNWNELGGYVTIFKRVSGRNFPDYYGEPQSGYLAECWCSECGQTWHTAWGGDKSLIVADGEDGYIYPISQEAAEYGADLVSRIQSGGTGICPMCGEGVKFVHVADFGRRQMTRRHFQVVRSFGGYTALVSWLACREIYPGGKSFYELVPWLANVIDEQGQLRGFRWDSVGRYWHKASNPVTPETTGYLSGEGYYGYVRGWFIELPEDDLGGQTGEKTGLVEYLHADGCFPSHYLRLWRKHRNIENLMKTAFAGIASKCVNYDASGYHDSLLDRFDLSKVKPHEIVGMSKSDFKHISRIGGWSYECYIEWRRAMAAGLVDSAAAFTDYWHRYGQYDVLRAIEMTKTYPGLTFEKLDKYLTQKQGRRPDELHLLADVWRMHRQVHLTGPHTEEEWWPRNLMDAHDRLAMMVAVDSSDAMQQAFNRTAQQLSPLLWTDGELCIVIPRSPAELSHEGRVLRHCVGGYSKSHVSGSPVFFVRHYRRPERPYYTLNIGLSTGEPRRLQLHGYGNERHGPHKEFAHTIPKKVLDFCDRWEKEILVPFWAEKQRNEVTA